MMPPEDSLPSHDPELPEAASTQEPDQDGPVSGARQTAEDAAGSSLQASNRALPVFYDEQRSRWPWFVRGAATAFTVFLVGVVLLIVSIVALPLMPRIPLPKAAIETDRGTPLDVALTNRDRSKLGFVQNREKQQLQKLKAKNDTDKAKRLRHALEFVKATQMEASAAALRHVEPSVVPPNAPPVVAGFYVNWDETSAPSLHRNILALTHVIPEWLHLKPAGSDYTNASKTNLPFIDARDTKDIHDITIFARAHKVAIVPLLNNFTRKKTEEEGSGDWDTKALHELVADPAARANTVLHIRDWLRREQMQGINIDFEEVDSEDRAGLVLFMKELYAALHPYGLIVTQDVQLDSDSFNLPELAKWNDWIVPMFYDQHAGGTAAGPVAALGWTRKNLAVLLRDVPPAKVVMGVGNHGYDWTEGSKSPEELTYQSAIRHAFDSQPDARIRMDKDSLNPTFSYSDTEVDSSGKQHEEEHVVWMQDAVSVYNQLAVAKPLGVRGAALWYIGCEDPSLWSFYDQSLWGRDWTQIIDRGGLNTISYGGQEMVDFEGDGELLQPLSPPHIGKRSVRRDPATGMIEQQQYLLDPQTGDPQFPSSYLVRRYGGSPNNSAKQIVLTFDDGPDPDYTPKILDILKQFHVPAAFFVVGKNAEAYPDVVKRMYDEGHEIGNHSYFHPDLFKVSPERQRLELSTTQRVIQAITGHTTLLFRPPYGGDTEPTTGKEVVPMLRAAELNYVTVGEKNDPQDWRLFEFKPGTEAMDLTRPRNADEIVKSVVVNREVGSIVLLHDGGGNRAMTIEALPRIIQRLRAMGYTFTTVADVAKMPREALMPKVNAQETLLVGADRYVFEVSYWFQVTLTTLFTLSLILGISRIAFLMFLAVFQRYRELKRVYPVGFTPSISVIIAAYNEEPVIKRTIEALLLNDYPKLEIIVVDDGSKDRTSDVVLEHFGDNPSVHLIRKENGGKASALNRGIMVATGDILVSLDADTLFASDTVSKLARHFADPKVGAVSGNVQVGNTRNIWTRWQALEYTTSQNFDRRAYDVLDCITVVPGAVGALRRSAVVQVGGYTDDTLAEDTDLTWKLHRAGWRIVNDNDAMAYTEAPETLRNLAKQRFRWAFGTLQCLWKHRGALGLHGAFGWIALPSLWLYQILFPAISPFMDVAVVVSLFTGNVMQVGKFYLLMFGVEFAAAGVAILMGKGNPRLLPWLFFQRFIYRQLMYYVVLKALIAAIRGGAVGWNKFERTGTATMERKSAA